MMKLGMIGCGNMGFALLKGMFGQNLLNSDEVFVYDVSSPKMDKMKQQWGVVTVQSESEVVQNAEVVILAVKPLYIEEVLNRICDVAQAHKTVIVSIAAGVQVKTLAKVLGELSFVRVMPNTPALVGEGASALYFEGEFKPEIKADVMKLFESVGTAVEVSDEGLLDVVTGLSGSGPAYVMTFINALADGAVKEGLDRKTARLLAAQTVFGSAKLVLDGLSNAIHPIELRDRVTSPGGTTAAALFALEDGAFQATVQRAVSDATCRSRELGHL